MKWKKTIISNIMNTHGNLELKKMIQTANKNDKLIEVLEEIIEQREYIDQKFITLLRYAAFLSRKEEKSLKREIYELVLKGLKIQEFPESIVSSSKNLKLPLQAASSFRACLTMRSRKTQLSNCGFEWKLNKKKEGYKFADMLGMPRPKVYEKNYEVLRHTKREQYSH